MLATHMPGFCTTKAEPMKMAGTSAAASGAGSSPGGTRAAPSAADLPHSSRKSPGLSSLATRCRPATAMGRRSVRFGRRGA